LKKLSFGRFTNVLDVIRKQSQGARYQGSYEDIEEKEGTPGKLIADLGKMQPKVPKTSDEGFDEKWSNISSTSDCNNSKTSKSQVLRDESSKSLKKRLTQYSRSQWLALFIVCYINFASNTSLSMLSSFFSGEAIKHGATQLQIGLIFGCYAIINAISCPILGYLSPYLGAKLMLMAGLLTSSFCSFAFSQLTKITAGTLFIVMCFIIRTVQAVGCASYYIGATVIIAREFSTSLTFAFGMGEIFTGLGMIAGPLIGGWLYQV